MKKIYFLLCVLLVTVSSLQAQTVSPSVVNFKELAEIDKSFPPPKFLKIGNRFSEEDEKLPVSFKMPVNANKKYQADSLKNNHNRIDGVSVVSAAPINNFIGLDDNATIIPPDIHGEAGLNHLMVVHNSEFLISDKSGVFITKVSSSGFWAGVSPAGAGDPHINFDKYTNRWIMIAQSNTASTSSLLVAVSQTSDPTGNWARYAIDVDPTNTNWLDYPLVGFNQNWLVVAANNFTVANSNFAGSQIYIISMADLNAGSPITLGSNA